jgi:hypothetical protein
MGSPFNLTTSLQQGFDFNKVVNANTGFISALKIGDVEFKADLMSLKNPEQPEADLGAMVGVVGSIASDGNPTGSIQISCQVTDTNRAEIAAKIGTLDSIEVTFNVVIYSYDKQAKKYYKTFYSDAALEGVLEKNGHDLALFVAEEPDTVCQMPENFTVTFSVKPAAKQQTYNVAKANTKNVATLWGITKS